MSDAKYVVVKVSSIIIGTVAVIGNAMVCHIIVRLKTMKTSMNYIKLCLAILDAISGLLALYYAFLNEPGKVLGLQALNRARNHSSILPEVLCKIEGSYLLTLSITPLLLMLMAYERHKAVSHPFSMVNTASTKAESKKLLPLAFFVGSIYAIIDVIFIGYSKTYGSCDFKCMPWWFDFEVYMSVFLLTQYIIPSIAIFVFYFRLIRFLRKKNTGVGLQTEARQARRRARQKNAVTIVFVVTLAFYICCFVPFIAYVLLDIYHIGEVETEFFHCIYITLVSLNSALNPFIYFIFVQSFRDGFRRVFLPDQRCCCGHNILCKSRSRQRSVDVQRPYEQNDANTPRILAFVSPEENQDAPAQSIPMENLPNYAK